MLASAPIHESLLKLITHKLAAKLCVFPVKFDAKTQELSILTVQPDDLATIIYTSGTTGQPKGVMLSHHNIASNVHAAMPLVDIGPRDRTLAFLPLCHIFARTADLYGMLAMRASISFAESTSQES